MTILLLLYWLFVFFGKASLYFFPEFLFHRQWLFGCKVTKFSTKAFRESRGRFFWSFSRVWFLYALLLVSFAFHLIWKIIRRTDPMIQRYRCHGAGTHSIVPYHDRLAWMTTHGFEPADWTCWLTLESACLRTAGHSECNKCAVA